MGSSSHCNHTDQLYPHFPLVFCEVLAPDNSDMSIILISASPSTLRARFQCFWEACFLPEALAEIYYLFLSGDVLRRISGTNNALRSLWRDYPAASIGQLHKVAIGQLPCHLLHPGTGTLSTQVHCGKKDRRSPVGTLVLITGSCWHETSNCWNTSQNLDMINDTNMQGLNNWWFRPQLSSVNYTGLQAKMKWMVFQAMFLQF